MPLTATSVGTEFLVNNETVVDANQAPQLRSHGLAMEDGEPAYSAVSSLADGGYMVSWLSDADGDGHADSIAVRRYGADHQPSGDVVLLGDLPAYWLSSDFSKKMS